MSSALLFPAGKTREIAMADPDVKDLPKQSVELLRAATQHFAHSLLTKCFDEARRKKRQTADMRDFFSAVANDDVLRAMFSPFMGRKEDESDEAEETHESGSGYEEEREDELESDGEAEETPRKTLDEILGEANDEEDTEED